LKRSVAHFSKSLTLTAFAWSENMFASIWAFVRDPGNRAVLGWIGGGIVVVIGGLWAAFKFFFSKRKEPTVLASNGGVAAGRDIRDTKINTRGGSKR
jgi:hypothetical protein